MAEATTAKRKKKKAAAPRAPAPAPAPASPPHEGILGWSTWALVGVVLVGGVVAWKLVGTSYKRDVETICNAEKGSGLTLAKDPSKLTQWVRDHLGTPEGNELYSSIADAKMGDRAKKLQDAAGAQHVAPCPAVQSYEQLSAASDYRSDLQHLCSSLSFPKFLASEDPVRLGMLEDWIGQNARSPRTKELADPLRQAAAGADRARILRDEANKMDVYECENAKSLESPPPPKPSGDPVVRLYTDPQVIGTIPVEDVDKVFASGSDRMLKCYEQGIDRKPDLAGHFTIKIFIDPNGHVIKDQPGEENTMTDRDVALCVARVVRALEFPKSSGPLVTALLPIELTHEQKAKSEAKQKKK